jgi:hypothetical protein
MPGPYSPFSTLLLVLSGLGFAASGKDDNGDLILENDPNAGHPSATYQYEENYPSCR